MANKDKGDLEIKAHKNIGVSDIMCSIRVTTVSIVLLEQAVSFLSSKKSKHYKICVVLAHTALEVEVSRVEFAYLKHKGFADDKIENFLRQKTNIARENRKDAILLFELITNHKLPDSIDFAKLRKMNDKRNGIVHKGEEATKQEAKDAIDFSGKAIKALQIVLGGIGKKRIG